MKKFKKFILSMLLNKKERIIIWNALWFSNHTYRRRGNINGAVAVSQVMQRVEYILGVTSQRSKEEVDKIVEQVIENIVKEVATKRMSVGYDKGKEGGGDHTGVIVLRSADCENCEETDCPIYKKKHAGSKEETETSVEETEKEEKDGEQAPENK